MPGMGVPFTKAASSTRRHVAALPNVQQKALPAQGTSSCPGHPILKLNPMSCGHNLNLSARLANGVSCAC